MSAADSFVDLTAGANDDLSLSEGDSDDNVSLASDLEDEELAEVDKRSCQLKRDQAPERYVRGVSGARRVVGSDDKTKAEESKNYFCCICINACPPKTLRLTHLVLLLTAPLAYADR